ncbi:YjeF family N-terminal domain protein [Leptospira ryugenii]|uniref:Bifunctional NAD(P)H-hydrate repair enzyme n=1 Tax=Leptospira ryugenii TaxID=1917863 RepID=A0A2P2DXC9_9LEPT|nr:bifunctional ADP-dependent NAD(P)H-hydrate dehydratase/NAD(P)H-hydrate epimerase [Leptospira ryugenii]GBF49297.1 YjeF family N-terminal domain protein [Leptospira ryugenii]
MDLNRSIALYSSEESKAIETYTKEKLQFSGQTLMGMAAISIFHANEELFETADEIWIFAGTGGNGGDGYALANILFEEGHSVRIFSFGDPKPAESIYYKNLCVQKGISIFPIQEFLHISRTAKEETILGIDAILGIGLRGPLREDWKDYFVAINSSDVFFHMVSLDTASGYTGQIDPLERFIFADTIEEIGTRKWNNIGYTNDGSLVPRFYQSIGFPLRSMGEAVLLPKRFYWEKSEIDPILSKLKRKVTSHKYKSGAAIFMGGSSGYEGAILLSHSAFHTLGGGISKIYTSSPLLKESSLQEDPSRMIEVGDLLDSDPMFAKVQTFVIGPGLLSQPPSLSSIVFPDTCQIILDAGAIPSHPGQLPKGGNTILTPHVGEFQKLVGRICNDLDEVYTAGMDYCLNNKVNILYKSYFNIYFRKDGNCYVWESPNEKLASMGTGDVLTGVLARFLSLGWSDLESVYASLQLLDLTREMEESYPSAFQILQFLGERV